MYPLRVAFEQFFSGRSLVGTSVGVEVEEPSREGRRVRVLFRLGGRSRRLGLRSRLRDGVRGEWRKLRAPYSESAFCPVRHLQCFLSPPPSMFLCSVYNISCPLPPFHVHGKNLFYYSTIACFLYSIVFIPPLSLENRTQSVLLLRVQVSLLFQFITFSERLIYCSGIRRRRRRRVHRGVRGGGS